MFGAPGHAYVYLIYGMYHCFNVITAPVGTPQGVLIRALEPVDGIEEIKLARYNKTEITKAQYKNLTNGPGKLCRALGITLKERGVSLQSDTLHIELVPKEEHISSQYKITAGPRINIDYAEEAVHYPWRFYYEGHPFVSKISDINNFSNISIVTYNISTVRQEISIYRQIITLRIKKTVPKWNSLSLSAPSAVAILSSKFSLDNSAAIKSAVSGSAKCI